MGDPLSITASIFAVLQLTNEIIKYGLDFAHAPKAILSLKQDVQSLQQLLNRLKDRCENALNVQKSPPPWLQGLWEVHRRPRQDGSWEYEYGGFIWSLRQAIDEAMAKLNPTKEWKKTETYQRITWHFKKDTLEEIQNAIQKCLIAVNTTLALKDDETIEEVKDLVKEGNAQLTQLNDRMAAFEKQEEKRRKEAEEAEREEITNWLSPFSFIAKQDELLTRSFTQVGEFLWSNQCFQAWAEGRPWFLWCMGDLGVGKTVLSSILAHRLTQARSQGAPAPLILFIYLDYESSKMQTLEGLVGSLLQQLLQLNESLALPEELKVMHKKAKRLGYKLSKYYSEVRRVLVDELKRFDRFYIIVDGFDELALLERPQLLEELRNLKPGKVSLLLTSRDLSDRPGSAECDRCHRNGLKLYFHCGICEKGQFDICYDCKGNGLWCDERAHKLVEPYPKVEVEVKFPAEDIERFVRWEIGVEVENSKLALTDERDTVVNPMTTPLEDLFKKDPELPGRIITKVTDKAAGRFLYARLYLDTIKTKTNLKALKMALERLPEKIDNIYKNAMQRIELQDPESRKCGFRILGILTRVRRSLGLEELKHALAVLTLDESSDQEDYSENDLNECVVETKTILGSTSSLVVVEANRVSLVHDSLEVYFREGANSSQWLSNAEFDLAKASMLYLQLVLPSQDCQDEYYTSKNANFAFLSYASQYWGDHVRDASQNLEHAKYAQMKAFQFLNDSQRLNACMQAAWVTNPGGSDTWDVWKGVDRLHICAWFGLPSVISELEPEPGTVDKEEPKYAQTSLMYACRKGHFEVVRLLLRLGASQKKASARGRTALFEAILGHHNRSNARTSVTLSRHAKVVELLAKEIPGDLDINMRHSQERDRTALMLAAQRGQLDMIEILLKHQSVGIDMQDANGMTAIVLAIREGHSAIVQRLLEAKADIEIVDFQVGRSPLRCAAERDRADIVKLLLRHNADPTVTDRERGTAILRAVNRGADQALEEMLKHGLDIKCVDEDGQSLLHGAARNGYDQTIGILLKEEILSVDVRDNWGMTPLHDASRFGRVAVASVLLKYGADASQEDQFQRTPFVIAWQYGQKEITSMLTSHSPEDQPPIRLDDAKLPIWAMARRGLTDLLTSTIKTRPQDLQILEPYSEKSSLHCAIEARQPTILQTLLEFPHILPQVNQRDHFGRSPLHTAALLGDSLACQFLLSAGADVNIKDRWDDPPIVLAHANGHFHVMLLFIKTDVNVTAAADQRQRKIDLKRLFFFAVEERDADAVGRLIGEYGVDRSVQNSEGWRAVQIATAADDEAMIRLLNAAPTVYMGEEGGGEMDNWGEGDGRREEAKEMRFVPFRSRPMEWDD